MARSPEFMSGVRASRIVPPNFGDVADLLDRNGKVLPFDPSYGETLSELLPRRLAELVARP